VVAEQREHHGQLVVGLDLRDPVVHSLRVSDKSLTSAMVGCERVPFQLRGPQQAELQLEAVALQRGLADNLRKASLSLPAQEVHLEQPETSVHVAGGQKEVVVGLRDDVGGAVGLEGDLDRLLEPSQAQRLVLDRCVEGHRPGAGGGIERGAERWQRPRSEEGGVEHRGRYDHRRDHIHLAPCALHGAKFEPPGVSNVPQHPQVSLEAVSPRTKRWPKRPSSALPAVRAEPRRCSGS
jgi:hypothetical protein